MALVPISKIFQLDAPTESTKAKERLLQRIYQIEECIIVGSEHTQTYAEDEINRLLIEYPKNIFPFVHACVLSLGALLVSSRGLYEDAVKLFKAAIDIQPESSLFHYNLAGTYLGLGNYNNALLQASQAKQTSKSQREQLLALGVEARVFVEFYKFQEANIALKQAFELPPSEVNPTLAPHFIYLVATGQIEKTEALLKSPDSATTSGQQQVLKTLGSIPAKRESVHEAFRPLYFLMREVLEDGASFAHLLEAIDSPPETLTAGEVEYVEWWRHEVHNPLWATKTSARLEVISTLSTMKDGQHTELPKDTGSSYEEWLKNLIQDPDYKGGNTVFPGTRLTVMRVGGSLLRGEKASYLIEDYPYLSQQDLLFSVEYAYQEKTKS